MVQIPSAARRLKSYPHEMSGGMRQRAMIALALSCRPAVLLADEPTTALDVTVQIQIIVLLRQLQQELGMAVVFVTHDVGVAVEVADRIAVMYAGRFVETGPTDSVIRCAGPPLYRRVTGLDGVGGRAGAAPGSDTRRSAGHDIAAAGLQFRTPLPVCRNTLPERAAAGVQNFSRSRRKLPASCGGRDIHGSIRSYRAASTLLANCSGPPTQQTHWRSEPVQPV